MVAVAITLEEPKFGEWQPIEKVPRDGREVLTVWSAPTGYYYKIQFWNLNGEDLETNAPRAGLTDGMTNFVDEDSQFWMPLPPPPEEKE
ncbi:MAG: hypothetical protein AAGD43_09370 [Pseudomonadota bacterium]